MRILLAIAVLVGAYVGGYASAIHAHGDWILVRSEGQCAALDPGVGKIIGSWSPRADRCHMSDFIWQKIAWW